MPFFDGTPGRVYYRHWKAASPQAQVIFLHGYGEHSAFYHRFASLLTARHIDLWALDAIGHGLTEGSRGEPGSVEDLAKNAIRLTKLAMQENPGLPTALVGHSMGAITAVIVLADADALYCGAILTGMPLEELTAQQRAQIATAVMSQDAFYLDELENDPLRFDLSTAVERITSVLNVPILAKAQAALPNVKTPVVLISGERDFLSPPSLIRQWAERVPGAKAHVVAGSHHDLINDHAHAEVGELIAQSVAGWANAEGLG